MFADIHSSSHFFSNSTLVQAHTASLLPLHPHTTGLDYYQDPADKLVALKTYGCFGDANKARVTGEYLLTIQTLLWLDLKKKEKKADTQICEKRLTEHMGQLG